MVFNGTFSQESSIGLQPKLRSGGMQMRVRQGRRVKFFACLSVGMNGCRSVPALKHHPRPAYSEGMAGSLFLCEWVRPVHASTKNKQRMNPAVTCTNRTFTVSGRANFHGEAPTPLASGKQANTGSWLKYHWLHWRRD